ncbi:hypothetical protein [Microvirga massiliensis]|uniref:hypothetical protein n=1 Tax=Microvirga massiliensis TaxID=1033741 RepID=UPI00069FC761|nr:hypothetical protein [Microvirga massiliensis]
MLRHLAQPYGRFGRTQVRNRAAQSGRLYGYGIKGFVLSMAETAIEVTDQCIPAEEFQTILAFGRTTREHAVEVFVGAREVLEALRARDHELWLISKGDLFDQESRIARSGLAQLFEHVGIVFEKGHATHE